MAIKSRRPSFRAIVLPLAAACFAALGSGSASAAALPGNGKLAFTNTYGDLYLVNADGSGLQHVSDRLTRAGHAEQLSWSPDGKTLAFFVRRSALAGDRAWIYTVSADGSNLRRLVRGRSCSKRDRMSEDAARNPTWSPDSSRIAFLFWSCAATKASLQVIDADGSARRTVTEVDRRLGYLELAWSNDVGTQLLGWTRFSASEQPLSSGLYAVGVDGSGKQPIGVIKGQVCFGLSVSPIDGRIARACTKGGRDGRDTRASIVSIGADGRGFTPIAKGARKSFLVVLGWSPDGAKLLYHGRGGLHIATADGLHTQKLVGDLVAGLGIRYATWSPDGQRIAFFQTTGLVDRQLSLSMIGPDGSDPGVMTSVEHNEDYEGFYGPEVAWQPLPETAQTQ